MERIDYENFMMKFRPLCEDVSKIAQQQKRIIELLELPKSKEVELFEALVRIYKKDTRSAAVVAELCDEVFDRSGGLLGRVRDAAQVKVGSQGPGQ